MASFLTCMKTNTNTHSTNTTMQSDQESGLELKNPREGTEAKSGEESDIDEQYRQQLSSDVKASVPEVDEDVPVNTFRAWFLAVISTMVLTALNQFFQLHNPPSEYPWVDQARLGRS